MAERGLGVRGHFLDAGVVANVQLEGNHAATQGGHFFFKGQQVIAVAAGDDEIRAGFRQGAREDLAQAAAGAGDDGYLAGEIEEFVGGVWAHVSARQSEKMDLSG